MFVAFLAYCQQVTLKAKPRPVAAGITQREVLAKFKAMQMIDVHIPTADGRELTVARSIRSTTYGQFVGPVEKDRLTASAVFGGRMLRELAWLLLLNASCARPYNPASLAIVQWIERVPPKC